MKKNNRDFKYIPALDGLRFFAFLLVFLHHSLLNISSSNPFVNYFLVIIQKNGWVGVDLFFVLSGYLITTLLLHEQKKNKKYSIKNFWIRRSLRIWPLYYLALLIGFLFPLHESLFIFDKNLSLNIIEEARIALPFYLTFTGNWFISLFGYGNFQLIGHLWTISLEEQFYLIWPLILIFIKNIRSSIILGFFVALISILTRIVLALNHISHPGIYTNTFARIDILVFGAILALINFYKPNILKRLLPLTKTPILMSSIIFFALFLHKIYLFNPKMIFNIVFGYTVIGLFMVYLVFCALQKNTYFVDFLSKKLFTTLGKISYGLYIWHVLAIYLSFKIFVQYSTFLNLILAFSLTILFGFISYYFFEIIFLRMKERFS